MRDQNRYLQLRNDGCWHYVRRVSGKCCEFDKRTFIHKGLDTKSVDVARARRDLFVEAEAVLGIVPKFSVLMSSAFEIYCNQIAVSELTGKSESQKKSWHKVKLWVVNNFIALVGAFQWTVSQGSRADLSECPEIVRNMTH